MKVEAARVNSTCSTNRLAAAAACTIMSTARPTTVTSQSGGAEPPTIHLPNATASTRSVANRATIDPIRMRTPTRSAKTAMALNPWPTSDTRFILERPESRFPRAVGKVLGSVLYRLVAPGELVLVNPQAPLLSLWNMARANLIDGVPMAEAAALWDLRPQVLDAEDVRGLAGFRRGLVRAWSEAVVAQVPLQAINLILVLPVIACIVVIFRSVIGVETFGTFAPVIVSLAFLMTGLVWGVAIFCVIVGLGVVMRSALQWVRIQLVARLAVLIALVSVMMAGLTVAGAYFGVGALLNVSIFPMVIMSNVIENFTTTQVELGTREAVRLTANTLLVCASCYVVIEWAGLQSIVLSFPEVLLAVVALEVAIGKWRGLRLLEYVRFADLGRPAGAPAAPPSEPRH